MGAIHQALIASAAAGGASTYLDQLGINPRCAHGMRKLISSASLCMRVRNRTTSVETDIGFSGATIDTSSGPNGIGSTYTGAQYVDVVRLYDQTGNGYHFDQATVARMPNIVSAGVYQGAIKFGGSQFMATALPLPMGTPRWSVLTRHSFDAVATRVFLELSANASGANPQAAFLYAAALNRMYMYSQNAAGAARQNYADCFIGIVQRSYLFDRSVVGVGELQSRQGGANQTMTNSGGSTEQTGNFNSYTAYLGARADGSLGAVMDLYNLAQYDADISTILAAAETIVAVAP